MISNLNLKPNLSILKDSKLLRLHFSPLKLQIFTQLNFLNKSIKNYSKRY